MKVLYVVNACDNKYVDFYAAQVTEENKNEFIVLDKINVEDYIHEFPKEKLYAEFEMGYVTDKLDKEALKVQIDRIYNHLQEKHSKEGETQYSRINTKYYNASIDQLDRCMTPEEYEKSGLKEQEDKKVIEKLKVFFE